MRERHRQETHGSHQRRHEYRTKTDHTTVYDALLNIGHALPLHLIHLSDKYDAVEYRHAKERYKAYSCRDRERHVAQPQRPHTTNSCKRNGRENKERLAGTLHRGIEQQENDDKRQRYNYHQTVDGTLQVLELSTIGVIITVGQLQLAVEQVLNLIDCTLNIASLHIESHIDATGTVLMRHLGWGRFVDDISQLVQRNSHSSRTFLLTCTHGDGKRLQCLYGAHILVESQHDVKLSLALKHNSCCSTGKSSLKHLVHIVHADTILRHALMVAPHLYLRQACHLFHHDTAHTSHITDHLTHLLCLLDKRVEVVAENLDGHILLDTRKQLIVTHLYGL